MGALTLRPSVRVSEYERRTETVRASRSMSRRWSAASSPKRSAANAARSTKPRQCGGTASASRYTSGTERKGRSVWVGVVLDVMTKDKAAIRLYERWGMQRLGTARHALGEGQEIDAVCYVSPAPEA
ncbi:hypothetical protein BKI49_10730 [Streptomyces sp. Tue6028]|nr:hypothetical protein BKI49_10730 [Streptomyces sp. Tue6028]